RTQRAERNELGRAREAATGVVEHEEHPPRRRESEACDDRRMTAPAAAPAVDDEAALLEGADADPGPRAAVRERGERGERDRNVEQRAECSADRERELRAGSEAHVLRNRAPNLD